MACPSIEKYVFTSLVWHGKRSGAFSAISGNFTVWVNKPASTTKFSKRILKPSFRPGRPCGLMQNILGITAMESEQLPDDVQHTKERKPDVLKKIKDTQGKTFVLHFEFQLVDDPEMVYRMADYHIMLARKYKIPIRQYVLFLGSGVPKMETQYEIELMSYRFPLIVFSDLDYHLFLKSDQPEEVILGVLADFQGESPETFVSNHSARRRNDCWRFGVKKIFQPVARLGAVA